MIRRAGILGFVCTCMLSTACVLDAFSAEGKQCPCPAGSGLICDTSKGEPGICVRTLEGACPCPPDSGLICDTSAGEPGICVQEPPCTPAFQIDEFRIRWTTPNTIAWEWTPIGPADSPPEDWDDQHLEYRVLVGASEEAVAQEQDVEVFDRTRNEELGTFYFRIGSGLILVSSTVIDERQPDTEYFARLVTVDNAGCEFSSPILSARTDLEPGSPDAVVLFEDDLLPGASTDPPLDFAVLAECEDGPCLNLAFPSAATNPTLFVAIPSSAFAGLGPNLFLRAYLEFDILIEAAQYVDYGAIGLGTGGLYWSTEPFAFSRTKGQYRQIQVPLKALSRFASEPDEFLSIETLMADGVSKFQIFGDWSGSGATTLHIDNVSIHW